MKVNSRFEVAWAILECYMKLADDKPSHQTVNDNFVMWFCPTMRGIPGVASGGSAGFTRYYYIRTAYIRMMPSTATHPADHVPRVESPRISQCESTGVGPQLLDKRAISKSGWRWKVIFLSFASYDWQKRFVLKLICNCDSISAKIKSLPINMRG